MISPNRSQTLFRMLNRLLAARVDRKPLTVSLLPEAPRDFCSSATMEFLSASERVGVERMVTSFLSLVMSSSSALRALAVGSSADVFTAAVY
jgi:hypothetical protein